MKRSLKYLFALTAMLGALSADAQYNPSIEVDGEYKPDVIARDRINTFPEPLRFGSIPGQLNFDLDGVVTPFTPQAVPMPATGWDITRNNYLKPGYLDFAMGSWLDARLSVGYKVVNTSATTALIYLNHHSTSLWKPFSDKQSDTKRYFYNEKIGVRLNHEVESAGNLFADAYWNSTFFNYYGFKPEYYYIGNSPAVPDQTLNNGKLRIGWKSTEDKNFMYYAGAGVEYTGYRRFFAPPGTAPIATSLSDGELQSISGASETVVDFRGGLSLQFRTTNLLGIDIMATGVFPAGLGSSAINESFAPEEYGLITILPYYGYRKDKFNFRIGPRLDFVLNASNTRIFGYDFQSPRHREKYHTFDIAGDLRVNWLSKAVGVELNILGGATLNTLAANRELDFYCQPAIFNTTPTYAPLDAMFALRFGPFGGFQARLSAAYRIVKGQRIGGWYQTFINGADVIEGTTVNRAYISHDEGVDISGISFGAMLQWNYGKLFKVSAGGTWQSQEGSTAYFNGYDLPVWTVNAEMETNPWRSLKFGLNLDIRGDRSPMYVGLKTGVDSAYFIENASMDNWIDLSLRASYDIIDNLTVGVELSNLLNRKQELLPSLPVPGMTAAATLSWQF